MKREMQYKQIAFRVEKQQEGSEFLKFAGYGSTFGNVDSDNEVMARGCFSKSLEKETPKMLLMHNSRDVPVGVWPVVKEDNTGLFVEGKLPYADDRVKGMIAPQMKIGSLDALSIGFIPERWQIDDETGTIIYTEVKLKEISLVTFPANTNARIIAVKNLLKDIDKKDVLEIFGGKPDVPCGTLPEHGTLVKSGWPIVWDSLPKVQSDATVDENNLSSFLWQSAAGTNCLPIGTKEKFIPSLVVSARAMLAGSKGGVDFSESDTEKVKENIVRYYEKMGFESPYGDEPKWTLPEIKMLGKADLDFVLRKGNLSRSASDYIASAVLSTQERDGAHTEESADEKTKSDFDKLLKTMEETLGE